MVYASVPSYLDPPNWNQQPQHHQFQQQQQQQQQQGHQAGGSGGGLASGADTHGLAPPAQPRPDQSGVPGTGARPGSMADRARLAKIPQPEPALKCPRCDSTNTKFCYFNNYSLSQPRHFCKTCRRYWTRGGALRNVPVGGGCRRNKRSKSSSSSKSSASNSHVTGARAASSPLTGAIGCSTMTPPPQLPFMTSLQHLADYGATAGNIIGLNYGGMQTIDPMDYHVGGSSGGGIGFEQWRIQQMQQLPFFTGVDHPQAQAPLQPPAPLGLYSFDVEGGDGVVGGFGEAGQAGHGKATAAGLISQLASVKMEENHPHGLSLARQYLGIPGNEQFWTGGGGATAAGGSGTGGSAWTDLSGFNSSSTGSLL